MPDYHRIDPLRFEAAVKDPSPFVVVLGDRRSGKTELLKQRMLKGFNDHNIVVVHSENMRPEFKEHFNFIERFYVGIENIRGMNCSDKNLFIDEFYYMKNVVQIIKAGRWKSVTMASSISTENSLGVSTLNQASLHNWYNDVGTLKITKFELQVD